MLPAHVPIALPLLARIAPAARPLPAQARGAVRRVAGARHAALPGGLRRAHERPRAADARGEPR
eukprot:1331642-Prymnesium_polylepis.1